LPLWAAGSALHTLIVVAVVTAHSHEQDVADVPKKAAKWGDVALTFAIAIRDATVVFFAWLRLARSHLRSGFSPGVFWRFSRVCRAGRRDRQHALYHRKLRARVAPHTQ